MIIFKTVPTLQQHIVRLKNAGKTIGFIPTMGALHAGHLSLIHQCKTACDVSVASIFVNPAQFNDPKDFEKYPVTIDTDCGQLEQQQTDILFLPAVKEMYPAGLKAAQHFNLGFLEEILEGKYRPGHFQGVCKAVNRLLEVVQPHQLFLGRKDYQQCKVITRLVQLMGTGVVINIVDTLREPDGLAMSSRNTRLNPVQRQQATAIYRQLRLINASIKKESVDQLTKKAAANLIATGFSAVDYVAIADAETLQPLSNVLLNQKAVALIAAFMGEVRLIDNMMLGSSKNV